MESIGDDLGGGILGVGSPWASDRGMTVDPLSFPGALLGGTQNFGNQTGGLSLEELTPLWRECGAECPSVFWLWTQFCHTRGQQDRARCSKWDGVTCHSRGFGAWKCDGQW